MRKLATAAFSFAAAVFISRYILPLSWQPVCCAAAAALSLTGLLFVRRIRVRIFLILLPLACGLIWSWLYATALTASSGQYHDETAAVTAVIKDYPSPASRGYRVDCRIRRDGRPSVGARVYYYNETELAPGDLVEFTAVFRNTGGSSESGRNDALSSRGAFLAAYVSGNVRVTGSEGGLRYIPLKMAQKMYDMIGRLFPDDVSPFLQALLTGRRERLYADQALDSALSASGIAHVVSVSGMHVSFLTGFLALIVKNRRRFAAVGIPVLLLFMAMTGFTPSVTRAGMMQVFLICAPIFRREPDSATSLSAALLILLLVNPYSCASVSLQLSFSATLGIIVFARRINSGAREFFRGSKLYRSKYGKAILIFIISNLATTTGALVFSLPLMALHFGYISVISPLTNLLTLWAVSLAFPAGLAACVIGFVFFPLASVIALPVTLIARFIIGAARLFAAIPYSVVYSSNAPVMFWLAFVYLMFILLPLLKARPRQFLLPGCVASLSLCVIILITPLFPASADSSVTALDVGQGQSIVLSSNEFTALVDCGSASGEDPALIAHEFLQNQGSTAIDLLILTHFHSDHVNGVGSLLSKMSVLSMAIPDPDGSFLAEDIIELARKRGTDIIYVTEPCSVELGELSILIFPPAGSGDENERGLTVLSLGSVSALITGDMNSSGERSLLRSVDLPGINVLIAGHHGSRHSTSDELLAAADPEVAVISVGRNSYGHPAGETLDRLEQRGTAVFRTDELGHVTISG